jgi:hypothetical protein
LISAKDRFTAIITGQLLGVLLIFLIGIFPFQFGTAVADGLNLVRWAIGVTLLLTFIGWALKGYFSKKPGGLTHGRVSVILWLFVLVDLVGLLFLVCQEQGLTKSMFVPAFFLIPAAYMAVEEPQRIARTYLLMGMLSVCIVVSYLVSREAADNPMYVLPLLDVQTTDFTSVAQEHNTALLIVSIASVVIPTLQVNYIKGRASQNGHSPEAS